MGYSIKQIANLQVQPVKALDDSRFQTMFDSLGRPVVAVTRDATLAEKAARKSSTLPASDQSQSGAPGASSGDYTAIQSSERDVFLTGSHGLTSQSPAIILTSPMTSTVADINTGTTTTSLVIDLNNEVKKSIEKSVLDALNTYGPTIGLTTTQFDQNVQIAKQYADLCLQTSLSKDKLVSLLSILNTSLDQNVNHQTQVIYSYFQDKPNLLSYLPTIDENYNDAVFSLGTNTQAVAQVLKTLYNYYVVGDLSFSQTTSGKRNTDAKNGVIDGSLSSLYTTAIPQLRLVTPTSGSVTLLSGQSTKFDFQTYQSSDNITSLVRLIQRDLVVHGLREVISGSENTAVDNPTAQDLMASYTANYKSKSIQHQVAKIDTPKGFNLSKGYDNITSFYNHPNDPNLLKFRSALVATKNNKDFGRLDSEMGIDYLIYGALTRSSTSPDFTEFTNTVNSYKQFADQIYDLTTRSLPDFSKNQNEISNRIKDNLLTFIQRSRVNTEQIVNQSSALRIGCFLLASKDSEVAAKLFRLICARDKQIHNISKDDTEVTTSKDDLYKLLSKLANSGRLDKHNSGDHLNTAGAQSSSTCSITKSALVEDNSSFQIFHTVTRDVESYYSPGDDFQNDAIASTTFGLSFSRDSRAFIIYNLFLDILRSLTWDVSIQNIHIPDDDNNFGSYEGFTMTIKYYPAQFGTLYNAVNIMDKNPDQFENAVNQIINQIITDAGTRASQVYSNITPDAAGAENFKHDAKYFYSTFLYPITQKIDHQNQVCLDMAGLLVNHASQLKDQLDVFKTQANNVSKFIADNSLQNFESLPNAIQSEQAFLKKNLTERYSKPLLGAAYLPSAIDHDTSQAKNVKTAVSTYPALSDVSVVSTTRKFVVVVGIPTGLLEGLRYQSTVSTLEHLYSIDLIFSNLQSTDDKHVQRSYTFTTRAFINEGSLVDNGPDTKASTLSSYSQIYGETKFKVIDDNGGYIDATPDSLAQVLGDKKIVDNHVVDHYAKLYLKSTSGVTINEEVFDLVPQQRTYPDAAQLPLYTTIVNNISSNYPDTSEGVLNKERVLRDLSRASSLSPTQHKISMMTSKTFEKIHAIPIDINDIARELSLSRNDIVFVDVVSRVRLSDVQPPVLFAPAPVQRSFVNAKSGDAANITAASLGLTDARSQGVDNIGINNMIETSNKFGGRLGGFR